MLSIYKPTEANGPIRWNWLTLSGPDSKDFLHRLTTVNVNALEMGQGSPGCFLTPQGRIRSYFKLWNTARNEYAFEFDAGTSGKWKTDLLATIDHFTFREQITVMDASTQLEAVWVFSS